MTLDTLADCVIAATFSTLAITITYAPASGAPVAVPAVPRPVDLILGGLGGGQQLHDGALLEVRVADLPVGSPAAGEGIVMGDRRYCVRSWRYADIARQIWLIDAVPV